MPRPPRIDIADQYYHVLNRANARLPIFFKDSDFQLCEHVLIEACEKFLIDIVAYVLMPNHFHLVLHSRKDGELRKFMQWITLTHTQRWHAIHNTVGTGHLYQGRYKSFVIEDEDHLKTVIRYVERNPVRAKLVKRAEQWKFSSMYRRLSSDIEKRKLLGPLPFSIPTNYATFINQPHTIAEIEVVREKYKTGKRGRPRKGT